MLAYKVLIQLCAVVIIHFEYSGLHALMNLFCSFVVVTYSLSYLFHLFSLMCAKGLLCCYVFSILWYSCQSWTVNKDPVRWINAFKQNSSVNNGLLKIRRTDKISNEKLLRWIEEDEVCWAVPQYYCGTLVLLFHGTSTVEVTVLPWYRNTTKTTVLPYGTWSFVRRFLCEKNILLTGWNDDDV